MKQYDTKLSTTWRLEIETLSPLHVGAGGPRLLAGYDFVTHRGEVWVLDVDRAFATLPDDVLAGRGEIRPGSLLRPEQYADCARYRLQQRGGEPPAEIIACIRDVSDRPYLPGSSTKGALRTSLAWAMAASREGSPDLDEVGNHRDNAAKPAEARLFGRNPNQDLLRALRVSDAVLQTPSEVELSIAAVYSLRGVRLLPKGQGYRWHVETLPVGTRLGGAITIDEYPFAPQGRSLDFHQQRPWLAGLAQHCRAFARELARREAAFYADSGQPALAQFYRRLLKLADEAGPGEGLLQLGWGTGWTAKTFGPLLQDDPEFERLVQRYRLDRGRNAGVFPKTRRLVERGGTPELPLGWVRFRLVEIGEDRAAGQE